MLSVVCVSLTVSDLKEADRLQQSARKKYIIIGLLIFCIVGTIVAIFLILRFIHVL